jgi:hypothetical protein
VVQISSVLYECALGRFDEVYFVEVFCTKMLISGEVFAFGESLFLHFF